MVEYLCSFLGMCAGGVVWFEFGFGFGCHPRVSQVGVVEWALPISSRCMTFPGCTRVRFWTYGPTTRRGRCLCVCDAQSPTSQPSDYGWHYSL